MIKYFNHITIDTGHSRHSYRDEVSEGVIATMTDWVRRMKKDDEIINIYDNYTCQLLHINSKMADFMVGIDNDGVEYDVLRFTICLHSRYKQRAWHTVDGKGKAPQTPFIAVKFINVLFVEPALSDFERCLAWGFIDFVNSNKKSKIYNQKNY